MPRPDHIRTTPAAPDLTGPVRALPWADRAACAFVDPELFFPPPSFPRVRYAGETMPAAKFVCSRCPVKRECLEYALDHPELEGVWGETTEKERTAMRRERRAG